MEGRSLLAAGARGVAFALLVVGAGCRSNAAALSYTLDATPGDLNLNRTPGVEYQETFTFTVTNPTGAEYHGKAPTCQLFDVVVVSSDSGSDTTPIWRWSKGQSLCQHSVDTTIADCRSMRPPILRRRPSRQFGRCWRPT